MIGLPLRPIGTTQDGEKTVHINHLPSGGAILKFLIPVFKIKIEALSPRVLEVVGR